MAQTQDEIRQRLNAAKRAYDDAEREVRNAASHGFMIVRGEMSDDAAVAAARLAAALERYHESLRAGNEEFRQCGGKPAWGDEWLIADPEDEADWQDTLRRLREKAAPQADMNATDAMTIYRAHGEGCALFIAARRDAVMFELTGQGFADLREWWLNNATVEDVLSYVRRALNLRVDLAHERISAD